MRKNIGVLKWMFLVLLLAFGVGMVLPGSFDDRDLATAAAVVDGAAVSQQRYSTLLSQRLEAERRAMGGELTEAESLRIRRETLNGLIDDELALLHAEDVGQTMTEAEFREALLNDPSLKDQSGNFDQQRYQQILAMQAEQGVTWQEAEAGFQRGMLLNKVRGFFATQALLSPAEAAEAVAKLNRQVKAEAAVWALSDVQRGLKLSEEDLRSYYSRNKQRWVKPPQFKLRQILLRAEFGTTTATVKAKAEAVLAKLKSGSSFNALAAAENADEAARKNSGDLGWLSREDLRHPELALELNRLKPGQNSGVIETGEGFHIVKLEAKKDGFEPTYENTKAKVLEALGKERAAREAEKLAAQALAQVKAGKSLAEAAKANQGRVSATGWFGRDDEKALPALGESYQFAQTLLSLDKGEAVERPISTEKAVAIAVLSDARPGSAPTSQEKKDQRQQAALGQARGKKAEELYKNWLNDLRAQATIRDQSGVLAKN
jgi:parvulin-like peptidyl-prolyl isomerase